MAVATHTCADCGRNETGVAYLKTDSGVMVCEYCWNRGSYQ